MKEEPSAFRHKATIFLNHYHYCSKIYKKNFVAQWWIWCLVGRYSYGFSKFNKKGINLQSIFGF